MKETLSDRFWSKVENSSGASCWQWLGSVDREGYGRFCIRGPNGKIMNGSAHRVAYELRCGPIPRGMFVCHHCDNRGCVNPSHLKVDTNRGNLEDMDKRGRRVTSPGERNGWHKLTWDEVDWICVYANQLNWPIRLLAECFHVERHTITAVLSGKRWRR